MLLVACCLLLVVLTGNKEPATSVFVSFGTIISFKAIFCHYPGMIFISGSVRIHCLLKENSNCHLSQNSNYNYVHHNNDDETFPQ